MPADLTLCALYPQTQKVSPYCVPAIHFRLDLDVLQIGHHLTHYRTPGVGEKPADFEHLLGEKVKDK